VHVLHGIYNGLGTFGTPLAASSFLRGIFEFIFEVFWSAIFCVIFYLFQFCFRVSYGQQFALQYAHGKQFFWHPCKTIVNTNEFEVYESAFSETKASYS
jgi:hypothetical protein